MKVAVTSLLKYTSHNLLSNQNIQYSQYQLSLKIAFPLIQDNNYSYP
jgi:hypothetical protein